MKVLIVTIAALFLSLNASAIDGATRFDYYGQNQGLMQNAVFSLACDDDGFLWLGTIEGLVRFDGENFKSYVNTDETELTRLSSKRISNITTDAHRHLWIDTYDGYLCLFNQAKEKFAVFPKEVSDRVVCRLKYNKDITVVATQNSSLLVFKYDEWQGTYGVIKSTLHDIHSLYSDDDGNLWIATAAGVFRLTKEQLERNEIAPNLATSPMVASGAVGENRRSVLFGTWGRGLMAWDKTSQTFSRICEHDLPSNDIIIIRQIYGKGLLVGTADAHLYAIDLANKVRPVSYHGEGKVRIADIYVDRRGMAWVTTAEKGVTRVDVSDCSSHYYHLTPDYIEKVLESERPVFYEDHDGALWVGLCGGGLLRYDSGRDAFDSWLASMTDHKSIASNAVLCMTEDKAGNMWIGTGPYMGGLVKLIGTAKAFNAVAPIPDAKTLGENIVRAVAADKMGHVWVATRGGGYRIFDANDNKISEVTGLRQPNGNVSLATAYGMKFSADDRLWIATKGEGVFFSLDPVDYSKANLGSLRFCRLADAIPSLDEGSRNLAYALAEDNHGNIWVATYGGGLIRIDTNGGTFTAQAFTTDNSRLLNNKVRYVMVDHHGDLWVGSLSGVNLIRSEYLDVPNPHIETIETNADVCHIFECSHGDMFFSTIGKGLRTLSTTGVDTVRRTLSVADGLCDNSVYGVAEDGQGYVWVSTENGLNHIKSDCSAIEKYNGFNGLGFSSFSEASIESTPNNHIIVGGRDGYIHVSPYDLIKRRQDERLMLTGLWVNDRQLDVSSNGFLQVNIAYASGIELPYDMNNVVVSYAMMDFTDPENVCYSYKLVGRDRDWKDCGHDRTLVFNDLKHGEYTLEIRHQTFDGRWSDDVRRLAITILPPWWLTWWAKLLYVIIALAALIGGFLIWRRICQYRRLLLDLEYLICYPQNKLTSSLETFNGDLFDEQKDKGEGQRSKDDEFIGSLIKFAEDNYRENLSIEQIADRFNMSRTVFYNKVKTLTGKGPLDVIRQVKFRIAADLLRNGHNVSEAAMEIGYSDVKYFSKLFKSFFGHTPSKEKGNS